MMPLIKSDEYISVKKASELAGVSQNTIRAWHRSGKLRFKTEWVGMILSLRVNREDLEKIIEQRKSNNA